MSLSQQIKQDVVTAMKAGERDRVSALRLVLAELQKAEKDGAVDEPAILRRERKRRRESEVAYRDAGREDLAAGEAFEATLIETYLPSELSDADLAKLVADAIGSDGAAPGDFGRVMKQVLTAADGRADGKRVSAQVKLALGG